MKKVLFVGHRADRSGAPIALLHLLRWLRAQTDLAFEVVLARGGELEPSFRELAPVTVVKRTSRGRRSLGGKLWNRGVRIPLERARAALERRKLRSRDDIGLVYFNSLVSSSLLDLADDPRRSAIVSVHELKGAYAERDRDRAMALLARADEIIAVSRAVASDIASCDPALAGKTAIIHGCVPSRQVVADDPAEARRRVRDRLGIPEDALVVGGCGPQGYGKGTDLFIQLAERVCAQQLEESVHFVWFGAPSNPQDRELVARHASRFEPAGRLHIHGLTSDPAAYFAAFDVFALTSREDSFPLVVLEAACNALPIVCFEGAGGAPEFVGHDCGCAVPFLDVDQLARAVADLAGSEKRRRELGAAAAARVRESHDVDVVLPNIAKRLANRLDPCGSSGAAPRPEPRSAR